MLTVFLIVLTTDWGLAGFLRVQPFLYAIGLLLVPEYIIWRPRREVK